MSLRKRTLKGGLLLGGGQAVSQACGFVRNIIVARLLSPADFGIAAIFAMTLSLLEMLSNVGAEKLLIQAEDGDERDFQAAVQLIFFWRGLVGAIVLLFCAGPVSKLFGAPNTWWAFGCLASVPLLRGLVHLDVYRFQREMNYGPTVKVDIVTGLFALILAFPLAYWRRDYSAMLWIIIGQAGINAFASHWIAQRRYQWRWNTAYIRRIISFGWPLLINGILMFGIFQGDRFIIGSANRIFHRQIYSLTDLGVYSVAFALTLTPTLVIANIASALWLPLLSQVKNIPAEFNKRYAGCCQVVALIGGIIALPLVICGGALVRIIYGESYSPASHFIGWLAAVQAVRIIRISPTLAAMSDGDTQNAMISNLLRSSALGMAIAVAYYGRSLVWIGVAGFIGEVLALTVSIRRLHRLQSISPFLCLKPVAVAGLFLCVAAVFMNIPIGRGIFFAIVVCALLMASLVLVMGVLFPTLSQVIWKSFGDVLVWRDRIILKPISVRR